MDRASSLPSRGVLRHRTVRRIAPWLAIAAIAVAARWRWDQLVDCQTPRIDPDTKVFQQIAERPLGLPLVVASKPLIVPLVYRAAARDPAAIARFQEELAFAAWAILTASLVLALERRRARALAIGVGAAFLLAPPRVGFTGVLLSESINDSLMALSLAGALAVLRLRGPPRIAAAIATGALGWAWLLTRDTNAVIVAAAAVAAMIVWRGWRSRAAWAASALAAIAVGAALWSTTVAHERLPCQAGWSAAFTPRNAYPLVNNLLWRVFPDEHAGLPDALARFAEHRSESTERLVRAGPDDQALHAWLLERGPSIYARWLVRHPIDRARELIGARWSLLAGHFRGYMPDGWDRGAALGRGLTLHHWLLWPLFVAAPLLLRRPRADPLCDLVLCVVASGLVGLAASYYGDAAEVSRHCYGAGQQVVLGLFLALVAWVDHTPRRGSGAGATSPS